MEDWIRNYKSIKVLILRRLSHTEVNIYIQESKSKLPTVEWDRNL